MSHVTWLVSSSTESICMRKSIDDNLKFVIKISNFVKIHEILLNSLPIWLQLLQTM